MRPSLALVASATFVALEASAGRVPESPRSSLLNNNARLKREIQKRQVTTADLKRWATQPKRKRAEASPGACANGNLLLNGDFENGDINYAPWTYTSSVDATQDIGVRDSAGITPTGQRSFAFRYVNKPGPAPAGNAHLEQTVQLCAGTKYDVSFYLGRVLWNGDNAPCDVIVSIATNLGESVLYQGTPCTTTGAGATGPDACPLNNGGQQSADYLFKPVTVGPFSIATKATFQYDVSCTPYGQNLQDFWSVDGVSISKSV